MGKYDISYGKSGLPMVGYTDEINSYAAKQMEMRDDFVGKSVREHLLIKDGYSEQLQG